MPDELYDETMTDETEAEAGAADDDGGAAPEAEAAPTPASAMPDFTSPEFAEAVRGALEGYFTELASSYQEDGQQEEEQEVEYDPFDPNTVQALVNAQVQQALEPILGPVVPVLEATLEKEGQQLMGSLFDELEKDEQIGSFNREYAQELAQAYLPQTQGDARQALIMGARRAAEFARSEREAAVEAYKQSLQGIADTPAEPGVGGAGLRIEDKPSTYDEIIARHQARLESRF